MRSSTAFLSMVKYISQQLTPWNEGPQLDCLIHGSVISRLIGEPQEGHIVCPQCMDSTIAEYLGSVGGELPFGLTEDGGGDRQHWDMLIGYWQDWALRSGTYRPRELVAPAGRFQNVSIGSVPNCQSCGTPMQVEDDLDHKGPNILCASFSILVRPPR